MKEYLFKEFIDLTKQLIRKIKITLILSFMLAYGAVASQTNLQSAKISDEIENGSSTDLARVDTDDIESFSIMKDATATALYGSRAANGVILIKTKEGKEGKALISLRLENAISMPTRDVELADYRQARRQCVVGFYLCELGPLVF